MFRSSTESADIWILMWIWHRAKYLVDAKSIMGIFSLDMEKPLELCANTNDEALIDEKFKAFIQ